MTLKRTPINSVGDTLMYLVRGFRDTFSETGGESPVSFSNHLDKISYTGIPLDFVEAIAYTYPKVDLDQFVTVVLLFDAPYVDNNS